MHYKNSSGRTDSATIFVNVISQDAQNEAPTPPLAEARVLSNSVTRIQIIIIIDYSFGKKKESF